MDLSGRAICGRSRRNPVKRYIFSNGIISVDERVNLRPEKRHHHPLLSSPVWIKLPIGILAPLIPAEDCGKENIGLDRYRARQQR
jgi:hypothetical protein